MANNEHRQSLGELAFSLNSREITDHLAAMNFLRTAAVIRGLQLRADQDPSPITRHATRMAAEALAAAAGVRVPWPDAQSTTEEDRS